jgi:hypothetical protein
VFLEDKIRCQMTEQPILARAVAAQPLRLPRSAGISRIESGITATSPHRLAMSVAAAGLLVHLALVAFYLLKNEGRIEYFVHIGKESPVASTARRTLGNDVLLPHLDGHDGQFFWVQAHDPLLLRSKSTGGLFDVPTYRAQRVAYPLVGSIWLIGGERALLWGLLLTNLAVVALGGYAATRIVLELGGPARAGLAFALNPAIVSAVTFDTSDAMALGFLLVSVFAITRHRIRWAVAAGTIAALTKEPSLLALAGIALFARGIDRRDRAALLTVPVLAVTAWFAYVHWRLDTASVEVTQFSAPFYGYYEAVQLVWRPMGNWNDAILSLLLLPVAALVLVRFCRRHTLLMSAAMPFALMLPFLSVVVVDLSINSLRALAPAISFLILDCYGERSSNRMLKTHENAERAETAESFS